MKRRDLFAIAPLALAFPAAADTPSEPNERLLAVIDQLETWQGWESSCVVAAKAFAAWQMRKALGLELPDPQYAQMHIDYQAQRLADYRRSYLFERDTAQGKIQTLAEFERVLG